MHPRLTHADITAQRAAAGKKKLLPGVMQPLTFQLIPKSSLSVWFEFCLAQLVFCLIVKIKIQMLNSPGVPLYLLQSRDDVGDGLYYYY